jgi:hypothetical protein
MMGLLGLIAMRKTEHRKNHLRQVGLDSWLEYTNNLYNQQYDGCSSKFHFPFLSQDTNEEKRVGEIMNGVKSQQNV